MARRRMTENEKAYFFCLLFPPLWIFIPILFVCNLADAARKSMRR
jgi:hypothetical protein